MVAVFQHSLLVTIYNQFPTQTSVIQITNETAQYQHYISVSQIRSMDADTALCASQSRPSSFQPCIHSAFFTDHKPTHACVYAIHIQEHHSAQSSSLSSSTALSCTNYDYLGKYVCKTFVLKTSEMHSKLKTGGFISNYHMNLLHLRGILNWHR